MITNRAPTKKELHKPLNVLIVGAGIGGLSAAIFFRQQGHRVTILEQSAFANELGAAVHLAPNSNGLLRRMGIFAEEFGANPTLLTSEYKPDGTHLFTLDTTGPSKLFQHPWLLTHRVHLHNALKRTATSEDGKGTPAILRTSAKVTTVDPTAGVITLESGESLEGDLIIGADGVHSKTRAFLPGAENIKCFGSGKSAFRFLMTKKEIFEDSSTRRYAENDGEMFIYMGQDRRIIIYPCQNNELLNFVCIHPSAESQAEKGSDGWNQEGNKSKLIEVYKDWQPEIIKLLEKADQSTLKVWELLDMEKLKTWVEGRLALLGDAAHPFTPHQGQGAGQAIEDAAALAVVLPLGTSLADVPGRLKLYEKARYERAHNIQEFSRISGRDLGDGPRVDMHKYTMYNFGHDEWDHSTHLFNKWQWAQNPHSYWRMPISFGPMPGPRQRFDGSYRDGTNSTFTTASIKFKTSATLLKTLFPTNEFSFKAPGSIAYASFSQTTLNKMEWLGGTGYNHFGLYIHGVQYTKRNGEIITGAYLPILFENLADPILTGREELGMPKVYCELDVWRRTSGYTLTGGWRGAKFAEMQIENLEIDSEHDGVNGTGTTSNEHADLDPAAGDEGILAYKYVPKVGSRKSPDRGQGDIAYPVFDSNAEAKKVVNTKILKTWRSKKASIKFDAKDWESLPTLYHIVEKLSEIPVYEVVEAKVVEGTGVQDVSGALRIE